MSDHGREAWFPFLDEDVVALLHSLPLHEIADLHAPQGQGDKRILRMAARSVGLQNSTQLVKRAVQVCIYVCMYICLYPEFRSFLPSY